MVKIAKNIKIKEKIKEELKNEELKDIIKRFILLMIFSAIFGYAGAIFCLDNNYDIQKGIIFGALYPIGLALLKESCFGNLLTYIIYTMMFIVALYILPTFVGIIILVIIILSFIISIFFILDKERTEEENKIYKKNDLIRFLFIIVISLFTAFVGKIVVMYFGFKAIYGILIGLFVPAGIITMSTSDSITIKQYLGSLGLACLVLIVPTLGLSILFGPFVIGIIFIIWVAFIGLRETLILLQNFLDSQLKNNKDKK